MSLENLHNRIDLINIPFTERGSRLLLFRQGSRLSIRLAERWVKWENEVGHYRKRPPILTDFTYYSEQDEPLLTMDVDTYPHAVRIQNALGAFDWAFLDTETLMMRLPAGKFTLTFNVYAERGQIDSRGGTLRGKRNVSYTTNARLLENKVEPLGSDRFQIRLKLHADANDALLLNITPRLAFNRSIPDPDALLAQVKATWKAWFDATPPVLEEYQAQYDYAWWIMRSGLINTRYYFTREALVPSKIHYVGVWHWDQVFHALAYRHVDTRLAEDQLRILLDHQREDGMLPDAIHDEGLVTHLALPVDADVTKPPILTWAVLKIFDVSRHQDFLEEVYEPLTRWNRWWMTTGRNGNALCEYHHPFSSGLDDSPLWDGGMPVTAPDLNTYLVLQHESLAKIARTVGDESGAAEHEQAAGLLLKAMVDHMWDDTAGVFRAICKGEPIKTLTPFNLLPLLTGKLPPEITRRCLQNLTDPAQFWTTYPLSTVSIADPSFDPYQMWRGPVWINVNYLFVEALKKNGEFELAAKLRRQTIDLVMKHSDIYEYYHPMNGERPPKAAPMFGWSASLFIELVLEETRWQQTGRISED